MPIAIYKFVADFPVGPELAGEFPSGYALHDAMLLLQQATSERSDAAARAKARDAHGLPQMHIVDFGMLSLEALGKSNDVKFIARCQEAVRDGSSVIFYPESRPQRPASLVASAGFQPAKG